MEIVNPYTKSSRVFENANSQGMTVNVRSVYSGRAFSAWCGKGAHGKKVPDFILFHQNIDLLKSFLDGYTLGDGSHKITSGNRKIKKMCTVSKLLAFQLQQAYARLNIFANINIHHKAGTHLIEGRIVNQVEDYDIWFIENPQFTHVKRSKSGEMFYIPVRRVEKVHFEGPVHNVETS